MCVFFYKKKNVFVINWCFSLMTNYCFVNCLETWWYYSSQETETVYRNKTIYFIHHCLRTRLCYYVTEPGIVFSDLKVYINGQKPSKPMSYTIVIIEEDRVRIITVFLIFSWLVFCFINFVLYNILVNTKSFHYFFFFKL